MNDLNFAESETSGQINIFQKAILFFGERIVIAVFTLVVVTFAISSLTQKAFSENSTANFIKQDQEWFSNNVSFSIPEDSNDQSFKVASLAIPTPTPTPSPPESPRTPLANPRENGDGRNTKPE